MPPVHIASCLHTGEVPAHGHHVCTGQGPREFAALMTALMKASPDALPSTCRGSEGSAKPGKASFLRRSRRSKASAGSKAAPPQSQSSELKATQLQDPQATPEPLPMPQSISPAQPLKQANALHQQQRRHTEGSQTEAAHALDGIKSGAQGYGRSGSFSAASRQALQADEQKPQMTPDRAGSLGMSSIVLAGSQRRSLSANGDSQAPVDQWCAASSHVHAVQYPDP